MTGPLPNPVNYLDEQDLEKICHEMARTLFSEQEPIGLFKDHDAAKLHSSLGLPRQAVFGADLYPTIYEKAAILYYGINKNHPFKNGNKRMSAASLVVFLFMNDLVLMAGREEFRDKTIWLAKSESADFEAVKTDLVGWIRENTISRDEFDKGKQ